MLALLVQWTPLLSHIFEIFGVKTTSYQVVSMSGVYIEWGLGLGRQATYLCRTKQIENYTSFWKGIEVLLNVFFKVTTISMETINWNLVKYKFCMSQICSRKAYFNFWNFNVWQGNMQDKKFCMFDFE